MAALRDARSSCGAPSMKAATRSACAARTAATSARVAGERPPQHRDRAERGDRIGRLADRMRAAASMRLVLVGVGQRAAVPALQEGEEQRRQHRHARDRLAARQPLATVGAMKPGIFEKPSIATRWLVSRIAGLPKRSSTTSRYAARSIGLGARVQARDHVVGDVVVGDAADRRRRACPRGCTAWPSSVPAQAMQLWLALRMRIFASSYGATDVDHLDADRLPRRAAVAEVVLDHPLDEALAHHRRGIVPAGGRRCTRSRTSGDGRGVMRSTIAFGQVVFASTQARSAAVAEPRR